MRLHPGIKDFLIPFSGSFPITDPHIDVVYSAYPRHIATSWVVCAMQESISQSLPVEMEELDDVSRHHLVPFVLRNPGEDTLNDSP
jgi:hypothetical protein